MHYRNSWSPILHAAALWLNSVGFEEADLEPNGEGQCDDDATSPSSATNHEVAERRNFEELHVDRFHLIFG